MFGRLKKITYLVLRNKQNRYDNFFEMKLQKISANISPFAGINFVNNGFNTIGLSQLIEFLTKYSFSLKKFLQTGHR